MHSCSRDHRLPLADFPDGALSPYASPDCPYCHGTGRVIEVGRLYGDAPAATICTYCFGRKAAQRAENAAFAKHCTAPHERGRMASGTGSQNTEVAA